MTVYAVYIIKDGGITILSDVYQKHDNIPNSLLVGGLFNAVQTLSVDTLGGEMHTIKAEGRYYHVRSFGLFQVALITDDNINPGELIQKIGLRFMKLYGENLLTSSTRVDIFYPFKNEIKELLAQYDNKPDQITPTKILNTKQVFSLSGKLRPIALAMLALGEATLPEISKECNLDIDDTLSRILELQKGGFIGQRDINNQKHFFCAKID